MATKWTNEEKALLLRLRDDDGLEWEDICRRFGRSMGSVRGQYVRLKHGRPRRMQPDSPEQVEFETEGPNTATASSKSPRITTLEQLLEKCQVDLSIWYVTRYLVNKMDNG